MNTVAIAVIIIVVVVAIAARIRYRRTHWTAEEILRREG